ncbi:MAG: NAD(P)H-hydrate dehydratase [Taibaiella sp.]|nr:NAD(P)H-hydrate dehydratase [Taibaiella sp.]
MKIFSAAQIRECDTSTIKTGRISSAELMERAASRCVLWIKHNIPKGNLFVVLCGCGNNGGDGLAIARMLHLMGYGVKAFLLQISNEYAPDCNTNLQRLQQIDKDLVTIIPNGTYITDIPENIIVIDAILGTGINRATEGWLADFINHINDLPNRKISIDMPSGLQADDAPEKDSAIIKANETLSFQFYKRSFLHPEASVFPGKIHIIDIGLDSNYIDTTHTQYQLFSPTKAAEIYKPRNPNAHKGTCGSALLVGGQYGKIGAIVLSSKAALRAGAGLVNALVPECGYNIMQTAIPEVMCRVSGDNVIENIEHWGQTDAIGIGPGMGTDERTKTALATFINSCKKPIVIDADALNIIAEHPDLLTHIPKGSVLTPHPKEFARMFGENTNSMVQVDNARIQAMRYNINIVLKGKHTAVINSDGACSYNMTGNAGMATGGAGDVLTGIITGLMAQGYTPYNSAILGVYLHGLAGNIAAATLSQEALIASDIIDNLGKAFLSFSAK